jgi:hypothetical protein
MFVGAFLRWPVTLDRGNICRLFKYRNWRERSLLLAPPPRQLFHCHLYRSLLTIMFYSVRWNIIDLPSFGFTPGTSAAINMAYSWHIFPRWIRQYPAVLCYHLRRFTYERFYLCSAATWTGLLFTVCLAKPRSNNKCVPFRSVSQLSALEYAPWIVCCYVVIK